MTRILLLGGPPQLAGSIRMVSDEAESVVFSDSKTVHKYWPTNDVDTSCGLPIWRFSDRKPIPWPKSGKDCWTNV